MTDEQKNTKEDEVSDAELEDVAGGRGAFSSALSAAQKVSAGLKSGTQSTMGAAKSLTGLPLGMGAGTESTDSTSGTMSIAPSDDDLEGGS